MKKKKLVFGLGSGRCGSASLTFLLSQQESTLATHEMFPVLPWKVNTDTLTFKWTQMDHQAHLYDVVFDAGIYYFPYVQVLMKSWLSNEYSREKYDLKFVCLKREKEEVVKSYSRKFKDQNNNPLQDHENPDLTKNEWDKCFPKYPMTLSLEEAISSFYEDYYEICEFFQKDFPENFRIFETECLNTEEGVLSILNFVGYESPEVITNIRKREH